MVTVRGPRGASDDSEEQTGRRLRSGQSAQAPDPPSDPPAPYTSSRSSSSRDPQDQLRVGGAPTVAPARKQPTIKDQVRRVGVPNNQIHAGLVSETPARRLPSFKDQVRSVDAPNGKVQSGRTDTTAAAAAAAALARARKHSSFRDQLQRLSVQNDPIHADRPSQMPARRLPSFKDQVRHVAVPNGEVDTDGAATENPAKRLPSFKDQVRTGAAPNDNDNGNAVDTVVAQLDPGGVPTVSGGGERNDSTLSPVVFADARVLDGAVTVQNRVIRVSPDRMLSIHDVNSDSEPGRGDTAASPSDYRHFILIGAFILLLSGAAVGGVCGAGVCGGGGSQGSKAQQAQPDATGLATTDDDIPGFGGFPATGDDFTADDAFRNEDPFNNANPEDANLWGITGTSNGGLELMVVNALDTNWDEFFNTAVSQWDNGTPDALTLSTTIQEAQPACDAENGQMKVCNGNYGDTNWRGINKIILQNGWIYSSAARMNDYYLTGNRDEDFPQMAYTMCHEIGHGFGLPHTDENFFNNDLGNCMDYTNNPEVNMQPNTPNFLFLAQLYGTVGGRRVLPQASGTAATPTTSRTVPAAVVADFDDIDRVVDSGMLGIEQQLGWRKLHETVHGEAHEVDVGGGFVVQIHMLKAVPAVAAP